MSYNLLYIILIMAQQLEFNFKPRDATPEEQQEWINNELLPLGDMQLKFVAIMSVVQICTVGFMLLSFYMIGSFIVGD